MTTKRKLENTTAVAFWKQVGQDLKLLAEVPKELAGHVEALILEAGKPLHGNSQPVRVVGVDQKAMAAWVRPGGKLRELGEGQLFSSALAASLALGFNHNRVGQALSHARVVAEVEADKRLGGKGSKIRTRPTATVRGVTFQYEADVPE